MNAEASRPSTDRARVYRLLARVFGVREQEQTAILLSRDLPELLPALHRLGLPGDVREAAERLAGCLAGSDPEQLLEASDATFRPGDGCVPNETALAPTMPQEALTRTFELADIAGFYRAFGVAVAPGTERVDHIAIELEFMHLLAVKEAVALERGESAKAAVCRDASARFLRDHLLRWTPKLAETLGQLEDAAPVYGAAADLVARFVVGDLDLLSRQPRQASGSDSGSARP